MMENNTPKEKTSIFKNKEFIRTVKFVLFSISAGVVQLAVNALLILIWPQDKFSWGPAVAYLIALIISVIWNLTFNRKFTFKSASNYTIAMLETLGFYAVFAPASTLLTAWLTTGDVFGLWQLPHFCNWPGICATLVCMVLNLLTEFPFQRFVVFRKSIDQTEKKNEQPEEENEPEEK